MAPAEKRILPKIDPPKQVGVEYGKGVRNRQEYLKIPRDTDTSKSRSDRFTSHKAHGQQSAQEKDDYLSWLIANEFDQLDPEIPAWDIGGDSYLEIPYAQLQNHELITKVYKELENPLSDEELQRGIQLAQTNPTAATTPYEENMAAIFQSYPDADKRFMELASRFPDENGEVWTGHLPPSMLPLYVEYNKELQEKEDKIRWEIKMLLELGTPQQKQENFPAMEAYLNNIIKERNALSRLEYALLVDKEWSAGDLIVNSGLDGIVDGVDKTFSLGKYEPTEPRVTAHDIQYATAYEDAGFLTRFAADTAGAVGNTIPSALVGMVWPMAGLGVLGVNVAGDAYEERRHAGYSHEEASAYGFAKGIFTIITQKAFGGIKALGGKSVFVTEIENTLSKVAGNETAQLFAKYVLPGIAEGLEEYMEYQGGLIMDNLFFGGEYDIAIFDKNALYSALIGFFAGEVFNFFSLAGDATKTDAADTDPNPNVNPELATEVDPESLGRLPGDVTKPEVDLTTLVPRQYNDTIGGMLDRLLPTYDSQIKADSNVLTDVKRFIAADAQLHQVLEKVYSEEGTADAAKVIFEQLENTFGDKVSQNVTADFTDPVAVCDIVRESFGLPSKVGQYVLEIHAETVKLHELDPAYQNAVVEEMKNYSPVPIPEDVVGLPKEKKNGYDQIEYEWEDGTYTYEVRWHTRTPGAETTVPNWRIERKIPGSPGGKDADGNKVQGYRAIVEVLIQPPDGDAYWVQEDVWKAAENANRNGTTTQEQNKLLEWGHIIVDPEDAIVPETEEE